MVSFSCEACGDIFTKKKLDPHRNRCRGATFTCIDCMVHFPGTEYRWHTSCMSEEQKYQGALYKEKKPKQQQHQQRVPPLAPPPPPAAMAQPAYVESVAEEDNWKNYEQHSDDDSRSINLPEAPTPPSAVDIGRNLNVFDFMVDNPTPTASNVSLPLPAPTQVPANEEMSLVRFDPEANGDNFEIEDNALIHQDNGVVALNQFQTPAPKQPRRKTKESERDSVKKDKKRKRLHIETDQVMIDAPPVMHSGLTGGLKGLMSRPSVFPPSPDYSGDNIATPASPLKKTKSSKHHHKSLARTTTESLSNGLMAMIAGPSKAKSSKKKAKTSSSSKDSKRKSSSSSSPKRLDNGKEPKLLEYRPGSKDSKEGDEASGQMVIYKPAADHFLSLVTKGPESERGCSVNKALKRYHRERSNSGVSLSKLMEEKELFKSLRMKRNDRGEIVLFSI
ncbi:hypothetical protein QBC41DRAFT_68201 [Cercophora samala]|uniref:Zinc finger C2H2 LYAR-type domain-containing protein n=1 Tax=Cercophora samala TaxID=330535 RepID=A0AA39ZGT1_9PEZI|nr:hypothetical protein QBC41DRAFT_68201 [Cercophora samala]